ncbi:unnamed protein product [Pylaiella littoralis]
MIVKSDVLDGRTWYHRECSRDRTTPPQIYSVDTVRKQTGLPEQASGTPKTLGLPEQASGMPLEHPGRRNHLGCWKKLLGRRKTLLVAGTSGTPKSLRVSGTSGTPKSLWVAGTSFWDAENPLGCRNKLLGRRNQTGLPKQASGTPQHHHSKETAESITSGLC